MDVDEALVPISINPNNFPAKLWRLVNDPTTARAIRWDSSGEGVIIEQQLFEKQFLSPCKNTSDLFKTTNFTSFVRQLNLYGFRKLVLNSAMTNNVNCDACYPGTQHHFHNPNFKRNHPELLVNLKRLTTSNKAKLQAGIEVNSRPPSRYHRFCPGGDGDGRHTKDKRGSSLLQGQTHQESTHPYHPNRSQPMKEYNRTPIPPRTLMMGHGAAASPTIFTTDKGIPISVIHRYPGITSNPCTLHLQQALQGLPNTGGQKFSSFTPHHIQCKPGLYSTGCQCYPPGSGASNMTGSAHQTASFPHLGYYQPRCPVNMPGNQSQDVQNDENHEMKKCDINLDTVFQIVDELQAPSKICVVKVETPEKQVSVSEPSTSFRRSTLPVSLQGDDSVNIMQASPSAQHGPIIIAVSGSCEPVKEEQQERQMVSVPEVTDMSPGMVNNDEVKDSVVLEVEVSDTFEDASSQKSRSTRK